MYKGREKSNEHCDEVCLEGTLHDPCLVDMTEGVLMQQLTSSVLCVETSLHLRQFEGE